MSLYEQPSPVKILITCLFFTIGISEDTTAQKRHDLSFQYGLVTTPEIFDASSDGISSVFDSDDLTRTSTSWSGGFFGTYRYFFTKKMSVGVFLGFDRTRGDLEIFDEHFGESIRDFYSLGLEWTIHYLRFDYFQMYSGGGLAATMVFEDNSYLQRDYYSSSSSRIYPNFNFTFVGVRFGPQAAFFIESGFGYKGLFCTGLSFQF